MIVENAWRTAVDVSGENVEGTVRCVARELGDWSRDILGDLEKRIKHTRKELEECRRRGICESGVRREEVLKHKLSKFED